MPLREWKIHALLILLVLPGVGCRHSTTPEPILIGHIAPSSGTDKAIGDQARLAIRLAIEDINREENRLLGRNMAVLHPMYPPDEPDKLQPLAVRLIAVDRVAALLGGLNLDEVKVLGRAAQPYDVSLMTQAELPPERMDDVVSVNVGLDTQGESLARFAHRELKITRLALLTDARQAASTALASAVSREFAKSAGTRSNEWVYRSGADLSELVDRVKRAQAEAIVFAGQEADLGRLRSKLQAAGLKLPLLFGGDAAQVTALTADPETGNGVYVATAYVPGSMASEFAKTFEQRFAQAPDVNAVLAYDGLRILFQAMRRAKAFAPAKVWAELANPEAAPFDSLSGPLTFNRYHSARRPLYVAQVEAGRLALRKSYGPDDR
jgi:branched-chain amino acid transport system substrate-binding protein